MPVKCDSCGHEHSNWVPRDRLNSQGASLGAKVTAAEQRADAAESKAAELQAQIDSAPDTAALQRKLDRAIKRADDAEEKYANESAEWQTREVFLAAGIADADDRDLVMFRYGKLPEQGRPDLAAYLEKGAKEDRHLRHLFESDATTGQGGDESERGDSGADAMGNKRYEARAALPQANKGVKPSGTTGKFSARSLLSMPYDESRKENHSAIMDALRKG